HVPSEYESDVGGECAVRRHLANDGLRNTMRISSSQYQAMMTQSLSQNQERITYVTQQMANGNRIQVPSDDPVDSVRLSRLKREEASIDQYRDNISAVKQRMSKDEGYLQNMVNDMNSGRDLLV